MNMRNIKFFSPEEKQTELPIKDFMEKLKAARVEYGYMDSRYYYDDTYDTATIYVRLGKVEEGNDSDIFLNPKVLTERNATEVIVHETLHIVIWKFAGYISAETVIRKMLNESLHSVVM